MDHGFFGMAFDFDRNGRLVALERAADFAMFMGVMEESDQNELHTAGPDLDDLELMDDWERREVLEDAGLDPDDYDF